MTTMAAPEATFYFSLCAESFLAATRIDGLVAATQVRVSFFFFFFGLSAFFAVA